MFGGLRSDIRAEDKERAEFGHRDSAQTSCITPSKKGCTMLPPTQGSSSCASGPLYFLASPHFADSAGLFYLLTWLPLPRPSPSWGQEPWLIQLWAPVTHGHPGCHFLAIIRFWPKLPSLTVY